MYLMRRIQPKIHHCLYYVFVVASREEYSGRIISCVAEYDLESLNIKTGLRIRSALDMARVWSSGLL
jgi:hypothetical protein